MIDLVQTYILTYVIAIVLTGFLSSLKRSEWGLLTLIFTSIMFLILLDKNLFYLLSLETFIFWLIRFLRFYDTKLRSPLKLSSLDRVKIKEL